WLSFHRRRAERRSPASSCVLSTGPAGGAWSCGASPHPSPSPSRSLPGSKQSHQCLLWMGGPLAPPDNPMVAGGDEWLQRTNAQLERGKNNTLPGASALSL